jgi:acyl-CoA synthetase (AMP-forming)/AMP-acid ligase II
MICDGDRRWSYRDFDAWTNRVAHGLSALGLQKGDALALMSGNRAEFLSVYFACARLGLVCVPINLLWRQHELSHVLTDSCARAAVVEAGLLTQFCAGVEDPSPLLGIVVMDWQASGATTPDGIGDMPLFDFDALAADQSSDIPDVAIEDRAPLSYLYTSGTTSAPKGVIGTHLGIYLESLGTAIDTRMTEKDRLSVVLPLFHTAQLNALCTPAIAVGASMVIQRGFDAVGLHEAIERERISVLFALPMMIQQIVERQLAHPRNVSSLRLTVYAMAPMPEADLRRAIEIFSCDFSLMFGQTEMSPVSTFFKPEHQLSHPGAVGTPAVNVQVAIMAPNGDLLPTGSTGGDRLSQPQTMAGYLAQSRHRGSFPPWLVPLGVPAISTLMGFSGSRTASRMSSRRAARTSRPSRSSSRSGPHIPTCSKSPQSGCRTSTGAKRSPPSSSPRTADPLTRTCCFRPSGSG